MVDQTTIILRLLLAFGLGFVLGLERELRGQVAGLRTHILVSLGACLFTLCSLFAEQPVDDGASQAVRADITRIASQVVVGIGFLGGGAILRHGASIRGLTTAANLWVTASVGLAAGFGFHLAASATAALALFTLIGLRFFERAILRFRKRYDVEADNAHHAPDRQRGDMPRKPE